MHPNAERVWGVVAATDPEGAVGTVSPVWGVAVEGKAPVARVGEYIAACALALLGCGGIRVGGRGVIEGGDAAVADGGFVAGAC